MSAPAGNYAHIACCVEQSEGSLAALAEAARIRSLGPGRLSVLHVIELPPGTAGLEAMPLIEPDPIGAAREWLTELVAPIPGAEPVLVHHGGHVATTACRWAEEARVDLLIAGASRGWVDRILRGDFSGYLLTHAPCPVLFARPRP